METKYFYFQDQLLVQADSKLNNETICQLWRGFCANAADFVWNPGSENTFRTIGMEIPDVPKGKEFVIRVTPEGLAVAGRDYGGLARGLMVLMQRIELVDLEPGKEAFRIETCYLESKYTIEKRMIHICVLPETTVLFLQKTLRLFGVMQYTHVVLEYWGTLRYCNMCLDVWCLSISLVRAPEKQSQNRNCYFAPKSMLCSGGLPGIRLERIPAISAGTPLGLTTLHSISSKNNYPVQFFVGHTS